MTHTLRGLDCIQTTKISVYPTGHTTREKPLTFRAKGLNGKTLLCDRRFKDKLILGCEYIKLSHKWDASHL